MPEDKILVLDFGSQYTQLIARRIREQNVYSEIVPFDVDIEKIMNFNPKGIILSGGPASVYENNAPLPDKEIFNLGIPILGICYGMQVICNLEGGVIDTAAKREYGRTKLEIDDNSDLFRDVRNGPIVWMSHGDRLEKIPDNFIPIAHTKNSPFAAMADRKRKLYALQFHPEVAHTEDGSRMIHNFIFHICGCKPTWQVPSFIEKETTRIRKIAGNSKVICGLSGGVDSSVTAVLIHKAVKDNLVCIFVDNGLLRKGEAEYVIKTFRKTFNIKLLFVDASKRFLERLKAVTEPERKRKIIGNLFIEIFEEEASKINGAKFLAQGTLYPDVIESVSFKGPSATIKSHHNVGGLPEKMNLKLIEPLRELFKDEARKIGKELGLSDEILWRQPFPGPGLAIRCVGEVTEEKLDMLREADAIVNEEIRAAGLYKGLWMSFAVLTPIKTVGVMGDNRTYEYVCAVRAITSDR